MSVQIRISKERQCIAFPFLSIARKKAVHIFRRGGHTACEVRTMAKNKSQKKKSDNKSATNNQWTSTGMENPPAGSDRRDGPGGENKK